ncbi:hypothetical protein [Bartonella florencae]
MRIAQMVIAPIVQAHICVMGANQQKKQLWEVSKTQGAFAHPV